MPDRFPLPPLLAALALFLVSVVGLHRIHAINTGYNATDLVLPDGTPARLVLPGPPGPGFRAALAPGAPRPPLVVLTHGVIADKEMMSGLAHAMARHGVAVLTLDWAGHGANRNPFVSTTQQAQLDYVIGYMRSEMADVIDPDRVALMGHSMGAGATLEYGATHPDLDFTVAISGAWLRGGDADLPPNLLMIYAAGDIPDIVTGVPEAMATLTGEPDPQLDVTYGRFEQGTARRAVEVPGTDHITILFSAFTAQELVHWASEVWVLDEDGAFGDPRLPWFGVVIVAALLLSGVSARVLQPWLPVLDPRPIDRAFSGLAAIAVAILLAVLALIGGNPFGFVGAWGGDYLAALFALSGLLLLGYTVATGAADWRLFWPDWRATLGGAALLALIPYALFGPATDGVALHLTLPPHRVPLALWQLPPIMLFCVAQDAITKRGAVWQAGLLSLGSTIVFTVVIVFALTQQLAPVAVMLTMPVMIPLIFLFELPSVAIYASTRNYFLSGAYRGGLLAVIGAATWPLF